MRIKNQSFGLLIINLSVRRLVTVAAFLLLAFQSSLRAGGVVNANTDSALRSALAGGGTVTFSFDGTVVLTNVLTISSNTTIDGSGHQVTISGGNNSSLFIVGPGIALDLRNLTLANGYAVGTNTSTPGSPGGLGRGGAIANFGGQVSLDGCNLLGNVAQGGLGAGGGAFPPTGISGGAMGGAIYSSNGMVWATNTAFFANAAMGGQGTNSGTSGSGWGGAIYQVGGGSYFFNCGFITNTVSSPRPVGPLYANGGSAFGGAIYHSNGVLVISGCHFTNNGTFGGASLFGAGIAGTGFGGAIFSASTLLITNSTFLGNSAIGGPGGGGVPSRNAQGGALYLTQPGTISRTYFANNSVQAASSYNTGSGGTSYGGGIYNLSTLVLNDSTLAANTVFGVGGNVFQFGPGPGTPAFGGGLFNSGSVFATNVTFSGNAALAGAFAFTNGSPSPSTAGGDGVGGGLCNSGGTVLLANATFADNSAVGGPGMPFGSSLGGGIQNSNGTVTLINTIIAYSASGGNASGVMVDNGHNLSSDTSAGFSSVGSVNNTDPVLAPLDNYGGFPPTLALLAGSPAIDAGDTAAAPSMDERGHARPYGAASDIGAFESSPPFTINGTIFGNTFHGDALVNGFPAAAQGRYSVTGLTPGSISVAPISTNYLFVPTNRLVTVGPDQVNVNFTAYQWNSLSFIGNVGGVLHAIYTGTNGLSYRVLGSSNLLNWTPIATNTITPSNQFDIYGTNNAHDIWFYKVAQP